MVGRGVVGKLTVVDPLQPLSDAERALLVPARLPDAVVPMAATLTDERFSRPGVGLRAQARRHPLRRHSPGREVRLRVAQRPQHERALPRGRRGAGRASLQARFVVDGEVVAFSGVAAPASRACPSAASGSRLLLRVRPAAARRTRRPPAAPPLAQAAAARHARVRTPRSGFTPHRNRDGEALFDEACRTGWEGLIAKRADAPYTRGRSRDWLKFKCAAEQELVIGGFTAAAGHPRGAWGAAARLLRRRPPALRGQGGHRVHARRPCATWRRGWPRCAATTAVRRRAAA